MRLRKRLREVVEIDFFGASGRDAVEGLLAGIESSLRPAQPASESRATAPGEMRGRTWVTRTGVHVDRIASAWLIQRFIDPEARFKFVPGADEPAAPRELRFDMFEAEFTHEGDLCTFEVLMQRFGINEQALTRIGQIVHDIDLKDGKFNRLEAAGLDGVIRGLGALLNDDRERVARGSAILDDLYAGLSRG